LVTTKKYMIVTLICEPRTGSNNLTNWFKTHDSFDVLLLPSYKNSPDFQNGSTPKDYKFGKKHLFIKEEFHHKDVDFKELIDISNFVIFLYRENTKEQIESWVNVKNKNDFHNFWIFEKDENIIPDDEIEKFKILKKDFKEKYLDNSFNFKMSYEELYYGDGINKIVSFIDMNDLNVATFPLGERYRIEIDKRRII
jgi:hypothetical protein